MPEPAMQQTVRITLPDGSVHAFDSPPTGQDIAAAIGAGLAKAALAIRVDGELRDLSRPVERDAAIAVITAKDPEGLEILRHDAAHVLAEAVQELFPGTQVTIGPVIEDGFYYDFARDEPFSTGDLEAIEKKMAEIVDRDAPIVREVWDRREAVAWFEKAGEHYKAEIVEGLPAGEPVTVYRQGGWLDLCRGPHLPSTGKLGKAFKLMKVAGAYWRGDSRNAMLQRIYGTAWASEKDLKAYLTRLEEAEKRDHRRLGRELELFHMQEEAAGQVFWHDKGWTLWRTIEDFIRRMIREDGYTEVRTPMLVERSLWEKSGHWDKFGARNMFTAESEERILALKPMNCPCHIQIFKQGTKSYRDLPLRMAEFGACHRNEPSGALHGLMRVRGFTQDDAHIFCTEAQIVEETVKFLDLFARAYAAFGLTDINYRLATRPPVRAGSDEVWDKAEAALEKAFSVTGLKYEMAPGEGAFYGPKLEFHLRDAIGRTWQCGTFQLDFVLPERLDANYIGEDGGKHRPVMLHRAILGSMERFIGILIEHYAGKFPLWLAPVQAVVTTITNEADDYAREVHKSFTNAGIRAEIDLSANKINYKVREHSHRKVPFILAVGAKEQEGRAVAVRRLGEQKQTVLGLDEAIRQMKEEARPPA